MKPIVISDNPEEVFAIVEPAHVSDRTEWFRVMRNKFPDNKSYMLAWACEHAPEKVEKIIATTSFKPMVFIYCGGTFDHELENFVFCFADAGIHKYPRLVKALWDKLMNESPEPIIHYQPGLQFLIDFVQSQPKYTELLHFTINELFGHIVPGRIDPKDVIQRIRIVNGLYPKIIFDAMAEFTDGQKIVRGCAVYTVHKAEYEESVKTTLARKYPEDGLGRLYLSLDESRRLIAKINELFFN
ncbi:MAG: hypothetical protein Q7S86_04820 [bacterium]|nr:hypothetical protein [bacterium]